MSLSCPEDTKSVNISSPQWEQMNDTPTSTGRRSRKPRRETEPQDPEHGKTLRTALERRFCLAHAAEGLIELGLVREEDLIELGSVQQDLYFTWPE
jgi:hypothetical protein